MARVNSFGEERPMKAENAADGADRGQQLSRESRAVPGLSGDRDTGRRLYRRPELAERRELGSNLLPFVFNGLREAVSR